MRKMIFLLFFLIFITSNAFSRPTIKNLTSKSTSNKVQNDIPVFESLSNLNSKHWVSLGMGQTHLLGNIRESGNNTIGQEVFYHFTASSQFDFFFNFHYSKHHNNDEWIKLPSASLGVKYKFYNKDSLNLFALGGLGFYFPKAMRSDGQQTQSKTTAGINGGGGIDLQLNTDYAIGFIGHFHKPFTIRQEHTRDISGAYFNLMATIAYKFL